VCLPSVTFQLQWLHKSPFCLCLTALWRPAGAADCQFSRFKYLNVGSQTDIPSLSPWGRDLPPRFFHRDIPFLLLLIKGKFGTMPMHAQRAGSSLSSFGRNTLSSTWRALPGSSSSSAPVMQGVVAAAGGSNRYFAWGGVRSACLRAPVTPDFNTSVNVHEHTISLREKRTARIKEMGERTKGSLVPPKPPTLDPQPGGP
jgi:hypothetical protein